MSDIKFENLSLADLKIIEQDLKEELSTSILRLKSNHDYFWYEQHRQPCQPCIPQRCIYSRNC